MNTTQRIALACFIGATIGALLAMEFSKNFWWLGVIIGGLVGYLSYEFKAVIVSVRAAWIEVRREYRSGFLRLRKCINVVFKTVQEVLYVIYIVTLLVLTGLSWSLLFACAYPQLFFENSVRDIITFLFVVSTLMGVACILVYFDFAIKYRGIPRRDVVPNAIPWMFVDANALSVLLRWFPKLIASIKISVALTIVGKVIKRTFIMIHSEIRLLCMTDAMLGALVGYYCGNALIGGIAGAILGVLNYKLVSVRWLKLARA